MSAHAHQSPDSGPTPEPEGRLARTFAALAIPAYRTLWTGMAVSMTGMQMQQVARGLLAYDLAGTYAAVGVVAMGWGLPQLLIGLVGGAVADRVEKRRLLWLMRGLIAIVSITTTILVLTDTISILLLVLLGVAQGFAFAFEGPTRQTLIIEYVGRDRLVNALALNNTAMNATRIVAPVLAGVLYGWQGAALVYSLQAVLDLTVLVLLWPLPKSTGHLSGAVTRGSVLAETKAGLAYVFGSRDLRVLMLAAFVPVVVGWPYVTLLPGFAVDELDRSEAAFGIMSAMTGVGALVGSLGIAGMREGARLRLLMMIAGAGFGLGLLALGAASRAFGYPGALVALVFVGLSSMSYMTLSTTLLMTTAEPQYHGRVMSVYMLTFSLFPLMSGPLGLIADEITAMTTFEVLGGAIVTFVVLLLGFNRDFMRTVAPRVEDASTEHGSEHSAARSPRGQRVRQPD